MLKEKFIRIKMTLLLLGLSICIVFPADLEFNYLRKVKLFNNSPYLCVELDSHTLTHTRYDLSDLVLFSGGKPLIKCVLYVLSPHYSKSTYMKREHLKGQILFFKYFPGKAISKIFFTFPTLTPISNISVKFFLLSKNSFLKLKAGNSLKEMTKINSLAPDLTSIKNKMVVIPVRGTRFRIYCLEIKSEKSKPAVPLKISAQKARIFLVYPYTLNNKDCVLKYSCYHKKVFPPYKTKIVSDYKKIPPPTAQLLKVEHRMSIKYYMIFYKKPIIFAMLTLAVLTTIWIIIIVFKSRGI